jgi:phosphate starvation-inducible PhoH-like protein
MSRKLKVSNAKTQRPTQRNKTVDLTSDSHLELVRTINKKATAFKPSPITYKNKRQQEYCEKLLTNTITVATGPAGTAKTFCAVYVALQEYALGNIEKIIITKPSVEIGKTQGYLPGGIDEKMEPFTRSVLDCFNKLIGESNTNTLFHSKHIIEIVPLQMMRGLTFDNAFIICDEAQNAEYNQLKALLTRLGDNCKLAINGDREQTDLKDDSGLASAITVLNKVNNVAFVEFTADDIVRSGIVKEIILGYIALEKNK